MELLEAANAILLSFEAISEALNNPPRPRGWQTKVPIKRVQLALNRHGSEFKENIMDLLGLFADEEDVFADMCDNPRDESWRDATIANTVARAVIPSHGRIRDVLGKMTYLLGGIQDSVRGDAVHLDSVIDHGLLEDVQIPLQTSERTNFTESLDRVTEIDPFLSPRCVKSRNELLDEFGRNNKMLKRLLCPEVPAVPMQRQLGLTNIQKPIVHFWQHAKTLYDFIGGSWRCKCHKLHQTNLLLQHRENNDVEFNVLFLFGDNLNNKPPPWVWEELSLKPLEVEKEPQVNVQPVPQMSMPEHQGPHPEPRPDKSHDSIKSKWRFRERRESLLSLSFLPKKKRKFDEDPSQMSSSQSSSSSRSTLATSKKVAFAGMSLPTTKIGSSKKGDSLCETFKAHSHQQKWKQVLCSANVQYLFSQGSDFEERKCATRENRSLGNLLDSGWLNPSNRCLIALVLASSVYQLHSSPWLSSSWDSKMVLFFSSFTDSRKILMDKPFLSSNCLNSTESASFPSSQGPGDLIIESLGIALLELCFGKTLETFPEYKDMGQAKPSHAFSRGFALDLLPRSHTQIDSGFSDAIAWCLDHRETSLDEDKLRNDLFINVIVPLHQVHSTAIRIALQIHESTSFVVKNLTHQGDILNGGVGVYGPINAAHGPVYVGGTHHHYDSKVTRSSVSAVGSL